jgi:urease accessory protein
MTAAETSRARDALDSAGRGSLAFASAGGRTFVRSARARSPLKILTPKNHGHGAWVMLATLGGGLVDGDAIHLDLEVSAGATGLVGTQASTKVYRCPTSVCHQETFARVGDGGLLALVPDPVACFAAARYEQTTRIELAEDATLVLVDAFTAGRSARGERWDFHRYAARTEIRRGKKPLLVDAIVLDPAHGPLRERMGRFDAFATVVCAGPRALPLVRAAEHLPPPGRRASLHASASPLADDAVLVRFAGTSVEEVTRAVRAILSGLREILGDDPFARKW